MYYPLIIFLITYNKHYNVSLSLSLSLSIYIYIYTHIYVRTLFTAQAQNMWGIDPTSLRQ